MNKTSSEWPSQGRNDQPNAVVAVVVDGDGDDDDDDDDDDDEDDDDDDDDDDDGRFDIALFSGLEQTHCAFVACDSERVTVAFYNEL